MRLGFTRRRRVPDEPTELQQLARELAEAERACRDAGRRARAFAPGCPVAAAALKDQRQAGQRHEQLARRYEALTRGGEQVPAASPSTEAVAS